MLSRVGVSIKRILGSLKLSATSLVLSGTGVTTDDKFHFRKVLGDAGFQAATEGVSTLARRNNYGDMNHRER